jgi:hypothetical protein
MRLSLPSPYLIYYHQYSNPMTPDSTIEAVLYRVFKSSLNRGARCLIYINHTFPLKARSPVAQQPNYHEHHRYLIY